MIVILSFMVMCMAKGDILRESILFLGIVAVLVASAVGFYTVGTINKPTYVLAKLENVSMNLNDDGSYAELIFVDKNNNTYYAEVNDNYEFFKEHIGDWFKLKIVAGYVDDVEYIGDR